MKRLDQHWWYIERPFPWPLIIIFGSILVGIIAFAITLGVML